MLSFIAPIVSTVVQVIGSTFSAWLASDQPGCFSFLWPGSRDEVDHKHHRKPAELRPPGPVPLQKPKAPSGAEGRFVFSPTVVFPSCPVPTPEEALCIAPPTSSPSAVPPADLLEAIQAAIGAQSTTTATPLAHAPDVVGYEAYALRELCKGGETTTCYVDHQERTFYLERIHGPGLFDKLHVHWYGPLSLEVGRVARAIDPLTGPEADLTAPLRLGAVLPEVREKLWAAEAEIHAGDSARAGAAPREIQGTYQVFRSPDDHTVIGYAIWARDAAGEAGVAVGLTTTGERLFFKELSTH